MANKQRNQAKEKTVLVATRATLPVTVNEKIPLSGIAANPYLPGIIIFAILTIIALFTYKDYGVSYDEPELRMMGLYSYNYVFHGDQTLFSAVTDHHGAGFQLFLMIIEKIMGLSDTRDIILMRHLVTHIVFLLSGFALYILVLNLYKNKFLASLGFIILILSPRLYAHSFFNGGDLPFLSVFLAAMSCSYFAFHKSKGSLFFLLGILTGFATSIRIMGILLFCFLIFFLLIDIVINSKDKQKNKSTLINSLLFTVGFCFMLYVSWPYLWKSPITYFVESVSTFSHFPWNGSLLLNGRHFSGENVPRSYFPIWFVITVPELWIIAGLAGSILIAINFFRRPFVFFKNTDERNLLLYILCSFTPVLLVVVLHSVIYNDWRHLYFVYPSFLLIALYFVNSVMKTKYKMIVQGACILQLAFVGFFMVLNHPFHQLYFNYLVAHNEEYLRNNYDMEYWGSSYKQALDHVLATDNSKVIKVNCYFKTELDNNISLLAAEDRSRIQYAEIEKADYYITNFWGDMYDFPFKKVEYSATVLNSTIVCVYKVEKDVASQQVYKTRKLATLKKIILSDTKNADAFSKIGNVYFQNAQYDSAEIYAKQAVALDSLDGDFINNLAAIYGSSGKFPQSIDCYKRSIRLNAGKVIPYTNIGMSYFFSANYDSAVVYLNKAIAVDKDFAPSYEILAKCYAAAGNSDSAKRYEAIALKNNPAFKL